MDFRAALEAFLRVAYAYNCDRFDMHEALRGAADIIEHGDAIEENTDVILLIQTLIDRVTLR